MSSRIGELKALFNVIDQRDVDQVMAAYQADKMKRITCNCISRATCHKVHPKL